MKYNDNGQWKDLKVKAFDTLPIGSVVEYDGTEVPDGYEKVDNVLWENNNPTSNFGANTVTLNDNINNYSYYECIFAYTSSKYLSTGKIPINVGTFVTFVTDAVYRRDVSISGTSATFTNGNFKTTITGSVTERENVLIPIKIIGCK